MTNADAISQWKSTFMDNYGSPQIEIVGGHGAWLIDADGTEYLDMLAGIAVNCLGQAHPAVVEAVTAQIHTVGHCSNLFATEQAVKLGSRLCQRFQSVDPSVKDPRVFFCNSGAEANEAAFKLARLTGRPRILSSINGFHGRTMGALALTGQPEKRAPFEPMPGGVEYFEYGNIESLRALVEEAPLDVAAIVMEPIQGETGVIPAPEGFLREVRDLSTKHGILMIVDEVQTGVGRTGDFFAFQHEPGVVPDIVTMAKALGGGLPLAACLAQGKAASLFTPGSHGTTFGGNPVCCAAANAVLDVVDDAFLATVKARGAFLTEKLTALDGVESVRGRGLMLGVVLRRDVATEAVSTGLTYGLILNAPQKNVIRLVPPLVITEDDILEFIRRFQDLLDAL